MKQFKLTEVQAQAILDMRLARLAALERKKIEDELKEVSSRDQAPGGAAGRSEADPRT